MTQVDYFVAELDWRFVILMNGIWEILDDLADILEGLEYDGSPRPPYEFDPLQTIGKY